MKIRILLCILFLLTGNILIGQTYNQLGANINGSQFDNLGSSVAGSSDGNIVAIGSPGHVVPTDQLNTGQVKVYELVNNQWVQKGSSLVGEVANDSYGTGLDISDDGNVLVVGAPNSDGNGGASSFTGRIYIYEWNGSDWSLLQTLNGTAAQESFGNAISVSSNGSFFAVGVPGAAGGGSGRGAVRVFERTVDTWNKVGGDVNGLQDFETSGTSVSLVVTATDKVLAVGSPAYSSVQGNDDESGIVRIYRESAGSWGTTWTGSETIIGALNSASGGSVDLSDDGSRLAIGAPNGFLFADPNYVEVYEFNAASNPKWQVLGSRINSNLSFDDFGKSVGISGDGTHLIVGAPTAVETGKENGYAKFFKFEATDWTELDSIPGASASDQFGFSATINSDGTQYSIGAPANGAGGASAGQVRAYELFVDTTPPTVTIDALYTSDQTPALTGTVDDNDATISVTVNSLAYDATNNGNGTWTLPDNTLPVLNEGEYTISATATNALAISSEPVEGYLKIDLTDPDFFFLNGNLTGLNLFTEPVNEQPLLVTIAFGEEVTALNLQDIQINGEVGTTALAFVEDVAGNYYSLTIPLLDAGVDQQVTVTMPMGTVTDLAGNPNPEKSVTISYDGTAPAITAIAPIGTNTTNVSPIPIQIVFDEKTIAFESTDLAVTNVSSVSELTTEDSLTYTMNVTPAAEGALTVQLPLGAVEDLAGNTNAVASEVLALVYDITGPTVEITTAASITSTSPIMATVTFSEAVQSLVAEHLTITNGTVNAVSTEDNITYTLEITPDEVAAGNTSTAGIVVTIDLEADKVLDIAGNGNTAAPTSASVTFDNQAPEINLTNDMYVPLTAVNGDFTAYFIISEPVSTFDITDINVTNGTKSNFVEENIFGAIRYSVDIALTGTENVVIEISADAVTDALGFGNLATTFNIAVDVVGPTVAITSNASNPTNTSPIPVIFTFNEETTGFAAEDITEGNFTASEPTTEDNLVYTSNITPTANGELNISLKDASVQDRASNFNTNTGSFTITFDDVAPTVTIEGPDAVNSNEPFSLTFTFNEAIIGLEASNITLENAALGAITQEANVYSTTITPSGAGEIIVSVQGFTDLAGNTNATPGESASKTIIFDATRPTVAITGVPATAVTSKDPITFTFTFSEPVVDFALTDIAVTNASASDLTDNNPIFIAKITPETVGTIMIDIAENIVTDAAGNGNEAASASFEFQQKYSGGTGTETDPYLIANETDFRSFSVNTGDHSAHFLQTADIKMSGSSFTPIGSFSGVYDGQGFEIEGLTNIVPVLETGTIYGDLYHTALFYETGSAVLKNMSITSLNIQPDEGSRIMYYGAGLVVSAFNTRIENCYVTGNISGHASVGGIAQNVTGTSLIINSFTDIQINNAFSAGGLINVANDGGRNNTPEITQCYSLSNITSTKGTSLRIGGLAVELLDGSIISNSFYAGQLKSTGTIGGILVSGTSVADPSLEIEVAEVNNSFWDTELSGVGTSALGGTGLSTSEMYKKSNYTNAGWDFENTWSHIFGYPILKWQEERHNKPFTVSGKVVDENGNPFSAGIVQALRTFPSVNYEFTMLDASGQFSLDLEEGSYFLSVAPSNKEAYELTYLGNTNRVDRAKPVFYDNIYKIQMIAKSQVNQLNGNGRVSGNVVRSNNGGRIVQGRVLEGDPLAGVDVMLIRTSDEQVMTTVETDENGAFEITGIPAGEYQLVLGVSGVDLNLEGSTFTMDEEGTPIIISAAVSEDGVVFNIEEDVLGIKDQIKVAVYPNPIRDFVNIEAAGQNSLKLININGQVEKELDFVDSIILDVSGLTENVYILQIQSAKGMAVRKLIRR